MFFVFQTFSLIAKGQTTVAEKDLFDYFRTIYHHKKDTSATAEKPNKKFFFTFFPGYGYSLTTKSEFKFSTNFSFKALNANVSTFVISPSITSRHQLVFPARGSIWTKNNKLNFVSDFRLMKYPQSTFGLGTHSSLKTEYPMDYSYARIYETVYRKIRGASLIGLGFHSDLRWNIKTILPDGVIIDNLYKFGIPSNANSTGLSFNFLFDNRPNSIYPINSFYFNANLRENFKVLGSNYTSTVMVLDTRRYFRTSKNNENVLALWNFNWLTISGDLPYLDLPTTGWDMYNNSARGYIQGRLRGRNFLYQEIEYRFSLTRDKFFGGVVFANFQTVTDKSVLKIDKIYPSAGIGMRFKLKKANHTNLALDYAFGIEGSRGLSVNIGEVF